MTFEAQLRKWHLAGAVDLYGTLIVTEYGVVLDIGPEMAPTERYVVRGDELASLQRREQADAPEREDGDYVKSEADRDREKLHEIARTVKGIKETLEHHHEMLHTLKEQGNKIMATQEQHAAELKKVTEQFAKVGGEVSKTLQKVTDLEAALATAGNTTPEVDAAMDALKAQAQATDDLIPDLPTP